MASFAISNLEQRNTLVQRCILEITLTGDLAPYLMVFLEDTPIQFLMDSTGAGEDSTINFLEFIQAYCDLGDQGMNLASPEIKVLCINLMLSKIKYEEKKAFKSVIFRIKKKRKLTKTENRAFPLIKGEKVEQQINEFLLSYSNEVRFVNI